MATRTNRFYSNADGSTADLVYDDIAMTASGVLVHVPQGSSSLVVNAVVGGQPIAVTYPGGTDTTFQFPSPLPVSFVTTKSGDQGVSAPWLASVSITS